MRRCQKFFQLLWIIGLVCVVTGCAGVQPKFGMAGSKFTVRQSPPKVLPDAPKDTIMNAVEVVLMQHGILVETDFASATFVCHTRLSDEWIPVRFVLVSKDTTSWEISAFTTKS